jgi:hypothetical protein
MGPIPPQRPILLEKTRPDRTGSAWSKLRQYVVNYQRPAGLTKTTIGKERPAQIRPELLRQSVGKKN